MDFIHQTMFSVYNLSHGEMSKTFEAGLNNRRQEGWHASPPPGLCLLRLEGGYFR